MIIRICGLLVACVALRVLYLIKIGAPRLYIDIGAGVGFGLSIPCILSAFIDGYKRATGKGL